MGLGVLLVRLIVLPLGLRKVYKDKPAEEEDPGPAPSPTEIIINADEIQGEIDPFIYGNFIEVLGGCVYPGIWDEYNENIPLVHGGIRGDVLNEIKNLKVPLLRWPGGCFADVYEWKEGIGPREQRKTQPNKHWHWFGPKIGPEHDNHFGSDEFMLLINEIGAEPYININMGSGTIEEAVQWVEYMNGDETTEYGALRAKHGHPKPYGVKIWGIGNEMNLPSEMGCTSAEKYAEHLLEFAQAMRAVDPSLIFVAVGSAFEREAQWNRTVLEIAGDAIDYLSLHIYTPGTLLTTLSNNVRDFYNIIAGAFEMERRIQWMAEIIEDVMGDKKIPVAFDEWGTMWNLRQHFDGYYTLRDGLFAASVFEILHRNTHSVKMACWAQLVNVIPMIRTSPTDVYHNPPYLASLLFSNYAEKYVINATVTCDTRHNPRYGNIVELDIPYLGCSVTTNEEKDKLVIIGINRHHGHAIEATIKLNAFTPESTAQVLELNGPSHSAYNYFDKKDEVKIEEKKFTSAANEFSYTFPSHSVTAIILRKKKA